MFTHADGRKWEVNRDGHLTHFSRPGTEARFADNGKLVQAHVVRPDRSEITVRGNHRYEVARPDHTRFVGVGAHRSYMERPVANRPGYVSRTYVVGKQTYARVYQRAVYQNVAYYRYVPGFYFNPNYYGWIVDPWASPMSYAWDWYGDNWYNFWNSYFSPYPTYPDASLWLTDYTLAQNLQQAYDNQTAAGPDDQPPAAAPTADNAQPRLITPAIKQALADEIRQQVEAERAAAAQPAAATAVPPPPKDQPPPALDPKIRTFVVSQPVELDGAGNGCPLTPGDVIVRAGDTPVEQTKVSVMVISSKPGSCAVSTTGLLQVAELQEMYNDFRERIDDGLKLLADKQGKNGVPAGPAAETRPVAAGTAVPDLYAETELTQQQQAANQAEREIEKAAAGS